MGENKVAMLAIVVEDGGDVTALNGLLHDAADNIIGRMGIPYRQKNISLMSIALDAPEAEITALSDKIEKLDGISAKVVYR